MRYPIGTQAWPRRWHLVLCGLLLCLPTGCASKTGTGALAGGALGTGIGALAGRSPGAALVGGLIGAGAGTIVGAAADSHDAKVEAQAEARQVAAQQAARGPLGLEKIAEMTANNVGDDIIIEQIRLTGYVYNLNADHLIWLKNQGVSERVIRAMQNTGVAHARAYVPPPATTIIYQRPVYVAPPPPPLPPRGGVSIGVHGRF